MNPAYRTLFAITAVFAGRSLMAQTPPAHFDIEAFRAQQAAADRLPDNPGSGKFPALKETIASFPNHVIYRPADLSRLDHRTLGVLAWGNGACAADGASSRFHLAEIASHGYLVIAPGTLLSGPGAAPHPPPAPAAPGAAPAPHLGEPGFTPPPAATKPEDLRAAIDWALGENERPASIYFGRINPDWVAVSGWSCGGLQALLIASDPRVHAVVIHNSGIYKTENPLSGVDIHKDALQRLHTPVIYILGGPTDIAYENGMDDFSRIDRVPAMVVSTAVGHGGTFLDANGGRAASVAVSWLDWRLRGDPRAAQRFLGKDCGLCRDPQWTVERNRLSRDEK